MIYAYVYDNSFLLINTGVFTQDYEAHIKIVVLILLFNPVSIAILKMIIIFPTDDEAPNILKPISMNTITHELNKKKAEAQDDTIGCLLCKETYPAVRNKGEKSPLLAHLLQQHKIVIADVDKIADFNK